MFADVVIGFMETDYTVAETEGTVELQVAVLSGSLSSDVTVRLDTIPGTAKGT